MRRRKMLLALLVGVALGSGCASLNYSSAPIEAVTTGCDEHFRRWQYDIDPGGHFDAQAWSPPGFPYLRVDRFLASFELSELTPEQREEWLQRAHQKALTAWTHEADALGEPAHDRLVALRQCGQEAIARLQGRGAETSDKGWHRLDTAKSVPDSYRGLARVAGLYPLVAPIVRWRAGVVMGGLIEDYRQPYQPAYPWTVYAPPEHDRLGDPAELLARAWRRSSLGIPDFSESEAHALLSRYAPTWLLETRDDNDVPGRPGRGPDGELVFEPAPVVYTHLAYARLDGRILPQLIYLMWFAARPPDGLVDIYAGALDGFLWRVTLGEDGLPLIYDFVHPCGCYHQWLLVESGLVLGKKGPGEEVPAGEEPLWIAGTVPQTDTGMALYLSTGEHQLVDSRVAPEPVIARTYHFRPYDDLRGRSPVGKRLFRSDGLVTGSERSERFLLWPTGVVSAGGMRQWGQHAVAFTGRRHFDDPHLLQRYFTRSAVTGMGKGQPDQ